MVELTKNEAYAVAQMIDMCLLDEIRNDTDIDSMNWLINVVHAFEKMCHGSGYIGLTYPNDNDNEGEE